MANDTIYTLKPRKLDEYPTSRAHPLVKELNKIAKEYEKVMDELSELRRQNPPPEPVYDLSTFWLASNEFALRLTLANEKDIVDYITYWTRGPSVERIRLSIPYLVVRNGDVVTIFDGHAKAGVPMLKAPMHVDSSVFDRFKRTGMPMSDWMLKEPKRVCISGIDYTDKEIVYADAPSRPSILEG